jgi:hypothetical protein
MIPFRLVIDANNLVTGRVRHFPGFWKKTKVIASREFMTLMAGISSGA